MSETTNKPTPEDFTPEQMAVAEALYADIWTEPKPEYGEDWHHRFAWWMCVRAALVLSAAGLVSGRCGDHGLGPNVAPWCDLPRGHQGPHSAGSP